MSVDGANPLIGAGLEKLGSYDFLHGEDYTIFASDPYGGSSIFYRLDCVLDLEIATVRREDGVEQVVARSY